MPNQTTAELVIFLIGLLLFSLPYFLLIILLIRDLGREIERAQEQYGASMERARLQRRHAWEQSVAPLNRSLVHIKEINAAMRDMRRLHTAQRAAHAAGEADRVLDLLAELEAAYERFTLHVAAFEQEAYERLTEPHVTDDMQRWLRTEYLVLSAKLDEARRRGDTETVLALRAKLILLEEELERSYEQE